MKKRETELDILRLLAMLAVIWVHVGGMDTRSMPVTNSNCQILIYLKSLATWQIPVYVMISGRFFADPEREMPFFKIIKAIIRLVIAFVVWNVVYQLGYIYSGAYDGLNWKGILYQSLNGPLHFWYLYMIIGMYLISPFLRKITVDKRLSEYFILLSFVFSCITTYGVMLPYVGSTISAMLDSMQMHFVLGYSGYYILGYYLRKYPVSEKHESMLYLCGLLMLILGSGANTLVSIQEGIYTERFTRYTSPNNMIIACAIYTLFTKKISKIQLPNTVISLITKLSEYSFGVYLAHSIVLDLLHDAGLKPSLLHPIIMMPIITTLTFAITNVLVILIRKIPYVGRKIT